MLSGKVLKAKPRTLECFLDLLSKISIDSVKCSLRQAAVLLKGAAWQCGLV